jgi:hypothetical protein
VMSVSSDGVMVCLREEGWKEVKLASLSAVEQSAEGALLTHHSYRAGVWEASVYGQQLWAEACRRGLEKAKTVVCVSDGAIWIWNLMFMCFADRVEILDWWHGVQRLWTIANACLAPTAAAAWVVQQQHRLAHTHLRYVIHQARLLYPKGTTLPQEVRQALAYRFANRQRMCYRLFRQAGYPIGSGTVESACKVVVQQRLKQAKPVCLGAAKELKPCLPCLVPCLVTVGTMSGFPLANFAYFLGHTRCLRLVDKKPLLC